MADSNEIKPVLTNLTNAETKQAINALKPKSEQHEPDTVRYSDD